MDIHLEWQERKYDLKKKQHMPISNQWSLEEATSNQFSLEEAKEASDTTLTIMRDLNNNLQCESLFR